MFLKNLNKIILIAGSGHILKYNFSIFSIMVTEEEVKRALKAAVDPEFGLSVIDLGLIYKLKVIEGKKVYIKMTLTTPMCPLANAIVADVYHRVKEIPGVEDVDIELTFDPPWSPDMMTPEARKLLGI